MTTPLPIEVTFTSGQALALETINAGPGLSDDWVTVGPGLSVAMLKDSGGTQIFMGDHEATPDMTLPGARIGDYYIGPSGNASQLQE